MPIKHLAERRRYKRLGKIRLGIQTEVMTDTGKVKMRNNKPVMRPMATDHFVVKEEEEGLRQQILNLYSDGEPEDLKELAITFVFEHEEETFPQFLKMYRGDGQLRCMGDGEAVYFRRYFEKGKTDEETLDEVVISNCVIQYPRGWYGSGKFDEVMAAWTEQYGTTQGWGNSLECLGEACPQYGGRGCRPTGRLLFMIDGIDRLGFWEMVVHQHAIIGINSQLELARAFNGYYHGRPTILHTPFKLRLTGPTKMKVNGYLATVYTPELEIDPEWITEVKAGAVSLPALPPASVEEIWGDDESYEAWLLKQKLAASKPESLLVPAPEEEEPLDYEPINWEGFEDFDQEELPM